MHCLQHDSTVCVQVGSNATDTVLPRIISFAPSVELLFQRRADVHPAFMRSLAAAAVLSDRVPVFPLVPCDSEWLAHRDADQLSRHAMEATNMIDRFVVPFGPRNDLRCLWKAWACKRCHKLGMPWYELLEVLKHVPRPSRMPTESAPLALHMCAVAASAAKDETRSDLVHYAGVSCDAGPAYSSTGCLQAIRCSMKAFHWTAGRLMRPWTGRIQQSDLDLWRSASWIPFKQAHSLLHSVYSTMSRWCGWGQCSMSATWMQKRKASWLRSIRA